MFLISSPRLVDNIGDRRRGGEEKRRGWTTAVHERQRGKNSAEESIIAAIYDIHTCVSICEFCMLLGQVAACGPNGKSWKPCPTVGILERKSPKLKGERTFQCHVPARRAGGCGQKKTMLCVCM